MSEEIPKIKKMLDRLATSSFRSRFYLKESDQPIH